MPCAASEVTMSGSLSPLMLYTSMLAAGIAVATERGLMERPRRLPEAPAARLLPPAVRGEDVDLGRRR